MVRDRDSLYLLVTDAILRAEALEDLGAPGATAAHSDVSLLEEKIAELFPQTSPEGALARRGAVRAAVAAGERPRAERLIERFAAEPEASDALTGQLRDLLADQSGGAQDAWGGSMDGVAPDAPLVDEVVLQHHDPALLANTPWTFGDVGLRYQADAALRHALAS
jgi:hypothetical protein